MPRSCYVGLSGGGWSYENWSSWSWLIESLESGDAESGLLRLLKDGTSFFTTCARRPSTGITIHDLDLYEIGAVSLSF